MDTVTGSPHRKLVLIALASAGRPMSAVELAPVTELPASAVAVALAELAALGGVQLAAGARYQPVNCPPVYDRDTDSDPDPAGRPLPPNVIGYPVGGRHLNRRPVTAP